MSDVRIGYGYDAHRFGGEGPVVLCGQAVDHPRGVEATSDGDVAAHALCDAILGAAAIGDLGMHFPSSDPRWEGASSLDLLARCTAMVFDRGYEIGNADVTIVVQDVRVAPHRDAMRSALAAVLRLPVGHVSVKATTTDGLGWIGDGQGLAAHAIVTIHR
jgi:2-C-methyl-D-erythritol 2,4-cyclodiphosphate synthase